MFVKIIHNNSFPFNLEKNQLNSGFISKNIDYYYYYMEVYKGEEGEVSKIYLNSIMDVHLIINSNYSPML